MTSQRTTFRIGVTGHRSLPAGAGFRACLESAVARAIALADGDAAELVIVSALAEGADRLVVEIARARAQVALEAILPMEAAEYELDFAGEASRRAFRALLGCARDVRVTPARGSRDDRYHEAGLAMLARIDLLLAVWDGQPARGRGGTAEIVSHALDRGVPVLWISTSEPYRVHQLDARR